MTTLNQAPEALHAFADREEKQFRRIFALSVMVFLIVGLVARLVPRTAPRRGRKSLLAEAKATANTVLPFAFMG